MKERLLIVGASGHGKVAADIALKMDLWKHIDFLDDNETKRDFLGLKIIGKSADARLCIKEYDVFIAIGKNDIREKMHEILEADGASIPVLIHPSAVIGAEVEVGAGTIIMAGTTINCCTTIGKGCIINTGAVLDHDNTIDDFVHISPGAVLAGTVKIGRSSWIGAGCVVCNNVEICRGCLLGAGTVANKDISASGTYVGVPARRI